MNKCAINGIKSVKAFASALITLGCSGDVGNALCELANDIKRDNLVKCWILCAKQQN